MTYSNENWDGYDERFDHRVGGHVGGSYMHGDRTAYVKPVEKPIDIDPAIAAQIMEHRVGMPVNGIEGLTKSITIVMARNGVFQIRKNQIGVLAARMSEVTIPGLPGPDLQEGFLLGLPKIPWAMFARIVKFFRDVNTQHHTEAYCQVWYDHDARQYFVHVPLQDVSGGAVHHVGDLDKEPQGNLAHVLDIHSHHTMGAFFSGTDDADEARTPDRVYAVVGQIDKTIPATKWRVRAPGKFVDITLEEVIAASEEPIRWETKNLEIGVASLMKHPGADPVLSFPPGSMVDPFNVAYPNEWWDPLIIDRKDKRLDQIDKHRFGDKKDRQGQAGFSWPWLGGGRHDRGDSRAEIPFRQTGGDGGSDPKPSSSHLPGGAYTDDRLKAAAHRMAGTLSRFRTLGRPMVAMQFHQHLAGWAVYYVTDKGHERAPDFEEKALLESLPQARRPMLPGSTQV